MRTAKFPIEEFNQTLRLNPFWSTWTCFCEAIEGRAGLSKRTIRKYFKELVDGEDYGDAEKESLNYVFALAGGKTEDSQNIG